MSKEIILELFKRIDCITSHENLARYVDFCIDNSKGTKTRGRTTSHHILPCAKNLPWRDYMKLSENPWNKAELTYYDHYYAHYLLAISIDHISIQSAFCGMHKKDLTLGRIDENELISEVDFEHQYERRNELIRQDRLRVITLDDGTQMTKAKFMYSTVDWSNARKLSSLRWSGDKNPSLDKSSLEKMRNTKSVIGQEGKTLDTISAERAAETMKREFINERGEVTTRYRENAKKLANLLKTTDLGKRRAESRKKRYYQNCPMVVVKNALDESYAVVMSLNSARKLSPGIDKKTKDDYLGKSAFGRNKLTREGRSHLIGLYAERLP